MNKRRMIKRAALAAVVTAVMLLGGCSLADQNLQTGSEGDHLCGVYVTTEPEVEALDEKLQKLDFENKKYYAQKNEANSEQPYSFSGLEGIYSFFIYEDDRVSAASSPEMQVGFEMQMGQVDELTGTLYYTSSTEETYFFCYPIRKNTEGYYIGKRTSPGAGGDSGLGLYETESWTETVDGERMEKSFKYKLTFKAAAPAKTVVVKELDEGDQVVKTTDIQFKNREYTLKLQPQTCYMIVEETASGEDGKETVKRSIYDREFPKEAEADDGENVHYSYFADDSGFLLPKELIFDGAHT